MSTDDAQHKESNDDVECKHPDCTDTFASVGNMRKHHGHMHGSTKVKRVCQNCGQVDMIPPCRMERDYGGKYCSYDCSGEDRRVERITIVCANCGETEDRPERLVNETNYCDRACHQAHQVGENHPLYTLEPIECNYCGDPNPVPKWERDRYPNHYCDEGCYADYLSEDGRMAGKNNPAWVGGRGEYGEGWHEEKREAVRERDGRECQGCPMSSEQHQEVYSRKLSVHHIIPARQFDDPLKRNAMENLVTLCMSCHRQWEMMAPLRPIVV